MQKIFFDCYEAELQTIDRAHFVLSSSFMTGFVIASNSFLVC